MSDLGCEFESNDFESNIVVARMFSRGLVGLSRFSITWFGGKPLEVA